MKTTRACSIDGCERPHTARGWCGTHYQRWRTQGTVELDHVARVCSIDGCDKPHQARGWCQGHYVRWKNTGDPGEADLRKQYHGLSDYERFLKYVDISGAPDACWEWTGARQAGPWAYGVFGAGGTTVRAHRWLLGHLRGCPLEKEEVACHHCANPPCVNPAHLYIGDYGTNAQDTVDHGHHRWANATHCVNGHEFTTENTYLRPDRPRARECRVCILERGRAYQARKKRKATE
jgi:hypothetical protein